MKKLTLTLSLLCLYANNYALAEQQPTQAINATTHTDDEDHISLSQRQLIADMRNKWRHNFIPTSGMDKNQLTRYLQHLNKSANKLWADLQEKQTTHTFWQDTLLDNNSIQGQIKLGSTLYTIYQRIFILAKAWATPGVDLYHDPRLLSALTEILTELNKKYYNNHSPEMGNWWHWELGISRSVNNTLVILYDQLPEVLIDNYNKATRHFVRDPRYLAEGSGAPYSTTKNVFTSTGGNRVDSAQVVFVRGLLENNLHEINAAVISLPMVLDEVTSGDGFYADGSFIQHKDLPYIGTYGQVLLNGLGLIKNNVAGTPWDFSEKDNQRIYHIIQHTFIPWLYQGIMSDAVNGRSISRKAGQDRDTGASVINAIALFVDGAPEEAKKSLEAEIKSQLTPLTMKYYQSHIPENLIAWQVINRIQQDNQIQPHPVNIGGKVFSDMDRFIYRGNQYQVVVAMHSKRTGSYECINGENLRGQRTADGMTYLYLSGDDQYRGYWPLVDSQYLPGTTSSGKAGWCDEQYRVGQLGRVNAIWAGGVALDQWASASMVLQVPASSLTAKKSWFMTADYILMLGSDISSQEPATTTIANRKISDSAKIMIDNTPLRTGEIKQSTNRVTLNDQGKKITWQSLEKAPFIVSRKNRESDWADIGTSTGKLSGEFLKIIQPEQKEPENHYAWIVYPNQIMPSAALPEIIANTSDIQAIKLADNTIYANFWRAKKSNGIQALTPLALIIHPTSAGLRIAVSSPRRDQRVAFVLPEKFSIKLDNDNRVTLDGKIISVDVSHLRGGSYTFELNTINGD